jgi:hypothetical protein
MSQTSHLNKKEKKNGKRRLLIPSKEIQEKMHPITEDEFTDLVKRAISPAPSSAPATK